MVHVPLVRGDVARAVVVAAPRERRAEQRVEADPQRSLARRDHRPVVVVAVVALHDPADVRREGGVLNDLPRTRVHRAGHRAGQQPVASGHGARKSEVAAHLVGDAGIGRRFLDVGVDLVGVLREVVVQVITERCAHRASLRFVTGGQAFGVAKPLLRRITCPTPGGFPAWACAPAAARTGWPPCAARPRTGPIETAPDRATSPPRPGSPRPAACRSRGRA